MSELSYVFTDTDGNFQDGWLHAPAFGVALQLEPCSEIFDLYLMAEDSVTGDQYLLKFSGGIWTVVASGSPLLPISGISGINTPPSGGYGRKFGNSFWVSGSGSGDVTAWRSDNGGVVWAIKPTYENFADWPHGLPVCMDSAANIWWAIRDAGDIFVIQKSTNNGESASTSYTTPTDEDSIYHGAAHPTDANIIAFAGLQQTGGVSPTVVYVTTNGGTSWSRVELGTSRGPLTDSSCLIFLADGTLLYATVEIDGGNERLRVYSASAPYSSFSSVDLINENITDVWEGPFLTFTRDPLFLAMQWESGSDTVGRVWRRETGGSWTELTQPFAVDQRIFGLAYDGSNLFAIADNGANLLLVAKAPSAASGSLTWESVTAAVNTAAGVTLAILGPLIWTDE